MDSFTCIAILIKNIWCLLECSSKESQSLWSCSWPLCLGVNSSISTCLTQWISSDCYHVDVRDCDVFKCNLSLRRHNDLQRRGKQARSAHWSLLIVKRQLGMLILAFAQELKRRISIISSYERRCPQKCILCQNYLTSASTYYWYFW